MEGKRFLEVFGILVLCLCGLVRSDADASPGTPVADAPVPGLMAALSLPEPMSAYAEEAVAIKGGANFDNDVFEGSVTLSHELAEGAMTKAMVQWDVKGDAVETATVYISKLGATVEQCAEGYIAENYNAITGEITIPVDKPENGVEVALSSNLNLTGGEYSVWDKVLAVKIGEQLYCSRIGIKDSEGLQQIKWRFPCSMGRNGDWGSFADALNAAGLSMNVIQPVTYNGEWISEGEDGCCFTKMLIQKSINKADKDLINNAAQPGKFGVYSATNICKVYFGNSVLKDFAEEMMKDTSSKETDKYERPTQQTSCSSGGNGAAYRLWKSKFDEWNAAWNNYKYDSGMSIGGQQWGDDSYYGGSQPQKPVTAIDQLLYDFGLYTAEKMEERKQESIQALEVSISQIKRGEDLRHVANDIVTTLWTQNEWVRKPEEVKAVMKEILCRIVGSPNAEEAVGRIRTLLRGLQPGSMDNLEEVLDRIIRYSILRAIESKDYGMMVRQVFADRSRTELLRKKFLEGLGLYGAKEAFTHFSVDAFADGMISQANAFNQTVKLFREMDLHSDTQHILRAVANLTGRFTHQVVDNLADIIKNTEAEVELNYFIEHAINDVIKFGNASFTADLKKLLRDDAQYPISGFPLRLMIFLIQPERESCDLEALKEYVPRRDDWDMPEPVPTPGWKQPGWSNNYGSLPRYDQWGAGNAWGGQGYQGNNRQGQVQGGWEQPRRSNNYGSQPQYNQWGAGNNFGGQGYQGNNMQAPQLNRYQGQQRYGGNGNRNGGFNGW